MLIEFPNLAGQPNSVNATRVIRVRTNLAYEPNNTVVIDFHTGILATPWTLGQVGERLGQHIKLAELHSPVGQVVLINADAVAVVLAPSANDHPQAGSALLFAAAYVGSDHVEQQLRESVPEATAALTAVARA